MAVASKPLVTIEEFMENDEVADSLTDQNIGVLVQLQNADRREQLDVSLVAEHGAI